MRRALACLTAAGALTWALWPDPEPAPAPAEIATADPQPRFQPAPLPALRLTDTAPEHAPLRTDAPIIDAVTGAPARYRPATARDTSAGAPAAHVAQLGSIRMAPDPDALGASAAGFVPAGGEVEAIGPVDAPPTIDYLDPRELAFKREAGDLDNPVDEEEQIKRNAYGDVTTGDPGTADGTRTASMGEIHVDGEAVPATEHEPPSTVERHRAGRSVTFERRLAGLSPTESGRFARTLPDTALENDPTLTETIVDGMPETTGPADDTRPRN